VIVTFSIFEQPYSYL